MATRRQQYRSARATSLRRCARAPSPCNVRRSRTWKHHVRRRSRTSLKCGRRNSNHRRVRQNSIRLNRSRRRNRSRVRLKPGRRNRSLSYSRRGKSTTRASRTRKAITVKKSEKHEAEHH